MDDSICNLNKVLDAWVNGPNVILYVKNWYEVHTFERILFFKLGTEVSPCQQLSYGDDLELTAKDGLENVKTRIKDILSKYLNQDKEVSINLFFAYAKNEDYS